MEANKTVGNKKWKTALLTIAMVFQCMRIVVCILVTVFQKPLLSLMGEEHKQPNHFYIPVRSITTIALSSIIVIICYIIIKYNKEKLHITKEVVCIVLLAPVYSILNTVLTFYIIEQDFISNYDLYYFQLENIISLGEYVFCYSTTFLVIASAISIGMKLKNREMQDK